MQITKRLLVFTFFLLFNIIHAQQYVIDPSFDIGTGLNTNAYISKLGLQPDGKILVSGSGFTTYNGTSISSNLIRLNSDGSLDTVFQNYTGDAYIFAFQSNGKLLIENGGKILRYNTDGTIDNTFAMTPANNTVYFQNGFLNSAQLIKID